MAEKLSLKWNDFQEHVNTAFANLRDDKEFTDVTLVCADGKQADAHKLILSASSPFFKAVLSRNKHPHPLIFIRGMKSEDLMAILDFIYFGEATVFQHNLETLLAIAGELKLKGLVGDPKEDELQGEIFASKLIQTKPRVKEESICSNGPNLEILESFETQKIAGNPFGYSGEYEDLDTKIKSLMKRSSNPISSGREKALICKVCGKEGVNKNIKDHIEANHLQGFILRCNLCKKTYRTRKSLRQHLAGVH